ncbi:MAG: MBOAT family protein [Clostridiales bacterium]|nr:MBOAT family protein [Clostridiales bacterium]
MTFSSIFFLFIFLPIALIFYYIQRDNRARNLILVVFSLIFYTWGRELYWVIPILFTSIFDYFNGFLAHKYQGTRKGKFIVANSVIVNLLILGFFKYSGFIVENINNAFGTEIEFNSPGFPLGISFYTFMTISYVVDCYWDNTKPERSYLSYLTYISLFAHITAGPITRYSDIRESLHERDWTVAGLNEGISRIAIGLGKKVILANNLYTIVGEFFDGDVSKLSFVATIYGAILYSMFVYYDFSGYCDMAIGIGKMLGLNLSENFDYPFLCKDVSEFWRRWHITLGSFFRDYLLYIPIFGIRAKYLNLFLVWFTTGFWHGASWNYIIWGLYFGVFIFFENLIGKKRWKKVPVVIKHIYSKIVIIIGFGIFYFTDTSKLVQFFRNLVFANGNAFYDSSVGTSLYNNFFLIIASFLFCFPIAKKLNYISENTKLLIPMKFIRTVLIASLIIVSTILLVENNSQAFLYEQF